jgi:hypothetical protein
LTWASATPGTFFRAFSTRITQEAQLMPSIWMLNACVVVAMAAHPAAGRAPR